MSLGAFSGNVKYLVQSLQKFANQLDFNLNKVLPGEGEANTKNKTANS